MRLGALALLVALLLLPGVAWGQQAPACDPPEPLPFEAALFIGLQGYTQPPALDAELARASDQAMVGLRGGWRAWPWLLLEGEARLGEVSLRRFNGSLPTVGYRLQTTALLLPGPDQVFLLAGHGVDRILKKDKGFDGDTWMLVTFAGAGALHRLQGPVGWRAELRGGAVDPLGAPSTPFVEFNAGVSWEF